MSEPERGATTSALSSRQRALFEARLRERGLDRSSTAIPRRQADSSPPLSFAQRRLWFLDQMGAGAAYNVPQALRLSGRLDRGALERSLREIVRRHEALRATFFVQEGEPALRIGPVPDRCLEVFDLGAFPETEREEEARRRAMEEALRPFDLGRGPLVRATLLELGELDHVLLLTLHHIVSDGWSTGILTRELAELYRTFLAGSGASLPELPIQYGDFAAWQRDRLRGEVLEEQLSHWRRALEGAPTLGFPTDRPRPAVQTFRGASRFHLLPGPLAEGLRELSRRAEATLFMTLLAGFQALLHRYTGQEDIVVGSPIASRNRREIEGLIGFFVNALAMRGDVSGDPTFLGLLARVKETALGAYAHQDLPFEKMVEDLRPARDLGQNPIFQVTFALHNAPAEAPRLEGLTMRPFLGEVHTTRFDLELHLWETSKGLLAGVYYAAELFEEATIERLLRHYESLLQGVVARPLAVLSELPVLSEGERQQILAASPHPTAPARETLVHEAFGVHALRAPAATAVSGRGKRLTYGELDRRANQLARYLSGLGVGPDVRVGVCVERSVETAIGLLGVLRAGGAYVAMDPAHPTTQLEFVAADAGVKVLLTQESLRDRFRAGETPVLSLDADWPKIAPESDERIDSGVAPENLAYVIYTSGSTGRPKGVEIPHRGLSSLVRWHQSAYAVQATDRATLIAGPAFDASVWELWPYLASGASVHVPDEETRLSPQSLERWLAMEEITVTFLPTALAEVLLKQEGFETTSLRVLLTGGDKLHALAERPRSFRVVNHYGPTECSVVATCGEVGAGDLDPSIGRAIDDARVYVLDRRQNLLPLGVPGELYIAGQGLARGYLGRPDLTAERFVPDPFAAAPGARMYRTGDLVRYRKDAQLEFLGRIDQQVKIRGFRIELGEVESVLRRHPAVREAVVVARDDGPGGKRLVAYVVHDAPAAPGSDLAPFLRERLPEYMVPSFFVALSSLPLTTSGKVDRSALPAPSWSGSDALGDSFVGPRTPAEEQVAAVWREVLQRERVGVQDNFFDVGGHSLLLVQVHARLREVFPERSLPVVDLFRHPTIEALAAHLTAPLASGPSPEVDGPAPAESRVAGRERLGRRRGAREALVAEDLADA